MRGPYRVMKTLPHGRYELQLVTGSYGKSTQAAAEYIIPWRGEWTPDVCAAYFSDSDDEGSTSAAAEPLPRDNEHLPEASILSIQPSTSNEGRATEAQDAPASMFLLETDLET